MAVCVFQTQVGHKNKKLQIGLDSSFNQALALLIVFATLSTASFCQITSFSKIFSKFKSFCFSDSISFEAGIQVHFAIIFAISFFSTLFFKKFFPVASISFIFFSFSEIFFSSSGISQYLILATSHRFHSLSAKLAFTFNESIFSLLSFIFVKISFSNLQDFSISSDFFCFSEIFFSKISNSSFEIFSAFFASSSIFKVLISFSILSSSTGFDIESSLTELIASSIKSIALSGNFLSLMYFIDKSTAVSIALSVILIQ